MAVFVVPQFIRFEDSPHLITTLSKFDHQDFIELDFSNSRWLENGPMITLLGKLHGWHRSGKQLTLINARGWTFGYLQRINFFEACGIELPEYFTRRPAGGRFVECIQIGHGGRADADNLSSEIAGCLFPELSDETDPSLTGVYDCIEYSVSELVLNVTQHSRGSGFVSAQFYQKRGMTQVTIADSGIGIRESFLDPTSPYNHPEMTHLEALQLAVKAQVSSKSRAQSIAGAMINAGVGLTLLRDVALASGGRATLISGNATIENENGREGNWSYPGTSVCLELPRAALKNFGDYLEAAKQKFDNSTENDTITEQDIGAIFK